MKNPKCIFTARKRSLGQGNIFISVCHSVHGGVCVVWGGTSMVLHTRTSSKAQTSDGFGRMIGWCLLESCRLLLQKSGSTPGVSTTNLTSVY